MSYLVVTLAVGAKASRLLEVSFPLMEAYAKSIGADMKVIDRSIHDDAKMAHFDKLQIGDDLRNYDRVLYLDADVIVRPGTPNIFDVVPETSFGAVDEWGLLDKRVILRHLQHHLGAIPEWTEGYFNGGVFVASRSHRALFELPSDVPWNALVNEHGGYSDQMYLNWRLHRLGIPFFNLDYLWNWFPLYPYYIHPKAHFIHFWSKGFPIPEKNPSEDRFETRWRQMAAFAKKLAAFSNAGWFFHALFPPHDDYWQATARYIRSRWGEGARLLAPNEFIELFFQSYPYEIQSRLDLTGLDAVVVHKGMMDRLNQETFRWLMEKAHPAFGNEVFAVFSVAETKRPEGPAHFVVVTDEWKRREARPPVEISFAPDEGETVILVTTYNRPTYLDRTLESLSVLGVSILVVNDGSSPEHREAYRDVYRRHPVRVIELPDNRGLSNAITIGLNYWLANDRIQWISYFQDDVKVRPDIFQVLAQFQDADKQPILSGFLNPMHTVHEEKWINDRQVLYQRSCSGQHLHAHRRYWERLLPIPTPYFGAPKKDRGREGQGADEDWWITCWSPHSITKQGGAVAIVPFLVQILSASPTESTWGNGAQIPPILLRM